MTSLPITPGVQKVYAGMSNTARTTNTSEENDFAGYLSGDSGKDSDLKADSQKTGVRVESRADRVKTQQKVEQTAKSGEAESKDLSECADEMATLVAEQFGIPVLTLENILADNGMTKEDLLTTEGIKEAVLLVTQKDSTAFITDDGLFSQFKELENGLNEIVQEFAEANHMDEAEVKELFAGVVSDSGEMAKEESTVTLEANVRAKTGEEGAKEEGNTENPLIAGNGITVESQTKAETVSKAETFHYTDVNTERIMEQITESIKLSSTDGISEMEMQLHPASLGNLHIHLSSKEGVLTAQFTAQNEVVKEVLQSQMVQLTESFKEQGITVEAIEVMVSSHKFEQSYEQAQSDADNSGKQFNKPKVRRLNLDALSEEEELTEEESLAKEMMEANGGTVDYMA